MTNEEAILERLARIEERLDGVARIEEQMNAFKGPVKGGQLLLDPLDGLQPLLNPGQALQHLFFIGHGRFLLSGISMSGERIPRTLPARTNWDSRGRWLPLSIRL